MACINTTGAVGAVRRHTAFPNLHNTVDPAPMPVTFSETAFQLPRNLSRESVILSWAILLRGYTGSDRIIFEVDGDERVVCVDFENDSVEDAAKHPSGAESSKHTALYFIKETPRQSSELCLHVDLEISSASLYGSRAIIPPNQMRSIVGQLLHIMACSPISPSCTVLPFPPGSTSVQDRSRDDGVTSLEDNTTAALELSILNPRPVKMPGPDLLHELIQSGTPANGETSAIEFLEADGRRVVLSYERLHAISEALSRKIAGALRLSSGNKTVPVLLPQSCSLYVALLSILKAGAAYVPLNLDSPQERVRFVVEDVGAGIIITNESLRPMFDWPGAPEVLILGDSLMDLDQPEEPTPILTQPILSSEPAYIMYTSGSTGKPKGVIVSHSAATQSLLAHDAHIPKFSRFLQFAAPTFDVSVFDTFFPLIRGCTLVGCERRRLLADLPAAINELDIDAVELTPTVAGELLRHRQSVPGLKVLLTIGEMLTPHVVDEFGDGLLHGMYGPTEAAIHCTVAPSFRKDAKVGDIGVPFDTVSAFIVAPQAAPQEKDIEILPVGWVGELAVGGWQLADGYLNRPDNTESAFVETPQWGRLYRTGDRARMSPSGRVECLGRVSAGQVKLRGQRVELGEVENVVLKTPGVTSAIASVVGGSLIVYISTPSESLGQDSVKKVCRQWLPGFMVPSDIVVYADLPRLPSGKVDRKLLDQEYSERIAEPHSGEQEDLNQMEDVVSRVVETILKRRPQRESSLVGMGLDSIQAIRLISRLRKEGLKVQVVDIINSDTIAGIASAATPTNVSSPLESAAVKSRISGIREAGISGISKQLAGEIEDIIPCTSVQESMISETARDSTAYCNWILLELPSAVDNDRVELAFRAVIQCNEILRTGFISIGDHFAQLIWKTSRVGQFKLVDSIDSNWKLSLDQMLEPPFSAGLMVDENGDKKLGIRMHHSVYDGWSWEHILSDFQQLLAGEELTTTRPQYRDVVEWELSRPAESIESAKQFWRLSLEGSGETKLPSFHGHSNTKQGVSVDNLRLSTSYARLKASARTAGVSSQVLFQAAWAYLLSSYVGKEDVVFGTVVSGRTVSVDGIEDIVGPTILTLPVRVQVGLHKQVGDLLLDIHAFNRRLLEHTELGLREVRKECGNEGWFDSLMVWQQTSNERDSESLRVIESKDKLEFSLLIEVEPLGDEIQLRATYRNEIFPLDQVLILLQQIDHLISGIVANPNRSLKNLVLDLETKDVYSIANPYPVLVPEVSTRTLATIFEETAAKYPDAVALEMSSDIVGGVALKETMTYAELNSSANMLARELVSRNAVPDELVAVCMEKSILCYVSILATVKARAGYLPLTPETPVERVKHILRDAGVKILLSTQDVMDRIGLLEGVDMVDINTVKLSVHSSDDLGLKSPARTLAYAVFTSGSTGVPKGVLVEHEQAVGNLDELAGIYPTEVGKRMLQFCNIAFDVSVFEIFFAWHRGMILCSATKDVLLRDMESAVNAMRITHLSMTPTVAALMEPNNVPGVEFLVTSGEAVTKKVFNDWAGRGLYQGYGPSETTNICTVNPRVRSTHDISNIGPPFSNTSAFVVNADEDDLVFVPIGGVGELCFGGVQVCRGYLNMEELTARKFVMHPKFRRIYRSGDMGRLLPNNDIMFVGRRDDQVKIRGNRIELGEINSILLKDRRTVTDSVTLVAKRDGRLQLVSFIVPHAHQNFEFAVIGVDAIRPTLMELFDNVAAFLPAYMVPNAIIPVSTVPMTHQGKTDKELLQRTFLKLSDGALEKFSDGGTAESEAGKWSNLERIVAGIIADITHVDHTSIGRNTSIFKLGLDSISAINLSSRFKTAGLPRLDVSQIMRSPTIHALARILEQEHKVDAQSQNTGAIALQEFADSVRETVLEQLHYSEDQIDKVLPCTPLQESTLSAKKGADPSTYYNHTVLSLKADPKLLKAAWEMVMNTRDIMRTCFAVTSHHKHAFAQVLVREHSLPWVERKLVIESELENAIKEYISTASATMDITKPPYSFGLFTSPERSTLVMSFHHSLYDGFAMNLLLEDVQHAYVYTNIDLPSRTNFGSYLEYMESIDLTAADDFWKQHLYGLEPTSFPDLTGKSNSARKQLTGMGSQRITCSKGLKAINGGCMDLSISLLALGQSAWARLLSAYTGESDICFGNVVSGRTIPVDGVETIIAPCFNTVPLRVNVSNKATIRSVMETLQELNALIMPFQLTPLRRIMTALKMEGQALFDTLFILQHANEDSFQDMWEEVEDHGEMDFSVVVELVPNRNKNSLEIVMHFRRDIVLEEHIQVLLQQFDSAIVSAIENAEYRSLDFSTFAPSLLSQANAVPNTLNPTGEGLLHSEFERNAHETPDRIALKYLEDNGETTALTFGEINIRANKIADYILTLGIERDEAIPLCMEKSPLFYICVLAVLKAGGAFTPIDPGLPTTRKEFMIRELGAKMVLVESRSTENGLGGLESLEIIEIPQILLSTGSRTTNPAVPGLTPNCLAYRLYTSGSTGLPKAVSLEHKSAVQTFLASKRIIPWESDSRLLQFAATTFDMCYYDIFMAWSYGFTLCSAAKKYLLGELEGTIKRLDISLLDLTPTVAATLSARDLPDVKLLYCIGEAMPHKLAMDWEGRCVNSYGPTEAAMCCTITDVSSETKSVNIGKPFENTTFVVSDTNGFNVMPVFASGELCIGGPQVAREYHNNPELTKSRFISFCGDVLYRTGDIVRQLADGTFEFIGRADDQVKIRGLRVELDEINTVLKDSHDDVKDATTIVLKHITGSKEQLVSFISLGVRKQHGSTPPRVSNTRADMVAMVRSLAQEMLPRYMVPGVILTVDHIPLSAAGKVDKKALEALFHAQDVESFTQRDMTGDDDVWSDDEHKIRSIFSEISQVPVEQIHKKSTIYEIGLDSISASQVALRLKQLGVEVSVIDILECPSIEQLSTSLAKKTGQDRIEKRFSFVPDFHSKFLDTITAERNIDLDSVIGIFPCTAVQEGMLSQFLRSHGKLYFNHTLLKLPGDIDEMKLKRAWESVFMALDILRSGFVEVDDGVHSFATITYQQQCVAFPWHSAVDVADDGIREFVEGRKTNAASMVLEKLHLPPWQLLFFRTTSGNSYLLFSGHHALYDATSLQIMFQDAAAYYYESKVFKRPQFGTVLEDIVKHTLDPFTVDRDRGFWLKQLEGSSICRMPNLCPVRTNSTAYHVKELQFSSKLSEIEGGCQERGISLHVAGQAAWARVLSAYTGETALTMGVVFSGRTGLKSAHDTVFPCLVTLPSLCVLADTTNQQLAFDIQAGNARALKHQHTPLKSMQRWFEHPEESFFDSIFVYQKTDGNGKEALLWEITEEDASVDYTFSLEIEPTAGDHLLVRATARNSHIPPEQTDMLIRQFEAVLVDILKNPDSSSTDLSRIQTELLSITPAEVDEIPGDVALLHEFVEKHRELCPDKVAFEFITAIDGDKVTKQTWTYSQLDEEGNKIANYLLDNGVTTGRIVGISFEKCPEASFAILGVLKAGCAYVAIDYSAPIDRKAFIIKDSDAFMVLTMDKYVDEFQNAVEIKVISAESDPGIKAASIAPPNVNDITPDNLSYCLYTSGTTGTPKGCELTHENAVQAMYAFQRLFSPHWDKESRFLQFASFHFDVSVLEQFWSWSVGVCVTSAPRDLIFQDLAGTINKLQITHLDLTPSLAALLKPEDVPSLCRGVFITGGEALKQDILDTWGETGVIYNGYGPTEVTIGMTMYPRVPANGKPSNIGPQFDNVGTYVFTPGTEKPVLRGGLGELCAAGKLVGRGYLNRPELTKAAFPVLEVYGEKIYRTGDLVRILHDGTFDFAGRADDQVKLRGQRLEIGEINQVVKRADASIEAVATLVLRHPKQQKDQLVSFVVLESEQSRSKPVLRTELGLTSKLVAVCRSKLPAYMVPTHFLPLSHMPLSVNNKVENKVLKALYQETTLEVLQQLAKRDDDAGEWSDSEQSIRAVLMEMTGFQSSEVKRSSTIFELGLDSVSVVGLARRLRKGGFATAAPSLIMQNPEISQMAGALLKTAGFSDREFAGLEAAKQRIAAFSHKHSFTISERLKLDAANIERIIPCTSLQEGMIVRFLDSDTPLYFNSFPMVLDASTDVRALHDAWGTVVQATEILRTCFCETPDGYAQIVLKQSPIEWEEVDIRTEDFQYEARRGLLRRAARNKNLHSPPISMLCIRTPTRFILVLSIFHALYDGNSLPLILSDVQSAYCGRLVPRPCQFGDVAAHLFSTNLKDAQLFWKDNLRVTNLLPLDRFLSTTETLAPEDYCEELKLEFGNEELDALCRRLHCTSQSILQAAWASALAAYCGPAVTLGLVVSGRSLPIDDIEGVIGPTFNTIPGTFDVAGAASWEVLVAAIHRFNSSSLSFHYTPLRLIHKWLRRTSEQPLFDTLFVYQKDVSNTGAGSESKNLWEEITGAVVADYPLALEVEQSASGEVMLTIVAKAELDKEKVSAILHEVAANLHAILENSQSKPSLEAESSASKKTSATGLEHGASARKGVFIWDEQALVIKKTIAELAEIGEGEIGADSSILELGLDSIEAIKLSSRLRQHGIIISVSTIMRNTSIRKMHQAIGSGIQSTPANIDRVAEFERSVRQHVGGLADIVAVYPTTPLQEAMIAETLSSDYTLYFNHDVLKLEEWVDLPRLRAAWRDVSEKNDILRTSFISVEDLRLRHTYGQVVHRSSELYWNEIQVSAEDDVDSALDTAMNQVTKQVDILGKPPVYVTILTAPGSTHLVLSISHALYDGWSIGLLHEDVKRAYFGVASPRPSARLMVESIVNADLEESIRFWKQILGGAVPSRLHESSSDPVRTYRAEKLSSVSFTEVQNFCKKVGATVQSLGQVCWALLLAHHLGETDVVFGSVLSGRDFEQADEIMFPAMNTIPVRAILHGSYKEMLLYMQDNGSLTLKHQHTPLREIQQLVNNTSGGTRLFDTIFLYQHSRASVSDEKLLYQSVGGMSDVEYNIAVEMERHGDTIIWRNACKSTVFSSDEGKNLLELLDSVLAHVIEDPEHPTVTYSEKGLIVGNTPAVSRHPRPVLNGVRINLDEIAATIKGEVVEVDRCAAILVNEDNRKLLVLFVTGVQDSVSISSVAKRILPYWSLPAYVVATDAIPMNGDDVNRGKLEEMFIGMSIHEKARYATDGGKEDEWSSLERRIHRILSKVSGLPADEIQRAQTIFHLGLDSISAIRLSTDLRKEGIFLTVADILREATIERMAAAAANSMDEGAKPLSIDMTTVLSKAISRLDMSKCLSGISAEQIEAIYPATSGQQYMLEAWKNSNYTLFMPTFTFRCSPIDLTQIQPAWESLLRQLPILRTTFRATCDEAMPFVQVVLKNPPLQFSLFQGSQQAGDEFLRFMKAQEQKKLTDMTLPPIRLYVQNTSTDTLLFLTIHHALYDGISLPLLLAKFQSLLGRQPSRLLTPSMESPIFPEYLAYTHSQDGGLQQDFWSRYLRGANSTLLSPKSLDLTGRSKFYQPAAQTDAKVLESRCRSEGISLHAIFLAAFAKVYSKRLSTNDVVFGVYLANRTLPVPDLPTMPAPTLNIVPIRVRGARTIPLVQLAKVVQQDLVAISDPGNAIVDLRSIARWTGVEIDCFFNYIKSSPMAANSASVGAVVLEEVPVGVLGDTDVEISSGKAVTKKYRGFWYRLLGKYLPLQPLLGMLRFMYRLVGGAGRRWVRKDTAIVKVENQVSNGGVRTRFDMEIAVRGDGVDVGVFSGREYFGTEELAEMVVETCGIVAEVFS